MHITAIRQSMIILLIAISSWLIQNHFYLNPDVGWFYEAASRLLMGHSYVNHFFENNPPWIIYLNIVPVFFSKFFDIHAVVSIKVYIFLIASISLLTSRYLLKKIFIAEDAYLAEVFLIFFAILYFIMPMYEFGQREHLFFMGSVPYVLLMVQRFENNAVNAYIAVLVGLLSGVFFIVKPYFLLTPILIEVVYLCYKKNFKYLLRPETIVIGALLLAYIMLVIIFHHDYLMTVLPLAVRYCYLGSRDSWINLFFNKISVECYIAFLFYVLTYQYYRYRFFGLVILLALIGGFFSYLLQQEVVFYRIFPAYAYSLFLFVLSIIMVMTSADKKNNHDIFLLYFFIFLLIYLKNTYHFFNAYLIFYPLSCYLYVTSVFLLMFFLIGHRVDIDTRYYLWRFLWIFVFFGVLVDLIYKHLFFYDWQWLMLYLFIIVTNCFMVPGSYKNKWKYSLYTLTLSISAIFPIFLAMNLFYLGVENKKSLNGLISFINRELPPNKSYYYFSTWVNYYLQQHGLLASRFSFFWPLPGLVKQSYFPMSANAYAQYKKDEKFFIDMVADDLNNFKPTWVLVETKKNKNYLMWHKEDKFEFIPFDYLTYFNRNQHFNHSWKSYHFLTQISGNFHVSIDPYKYHLRFTHQYIPNDMMINSQEMYLYLNAVGQPEIALRDAMDDVKRKILILDEKRLVQLKYLLKNPKIALNKKDKMQLMYVISKQTLSYESYRYDIYQRY